MQDFASTDPYIALVRARVDWVTEMQEMKTLVQRTLSREGPSENFEENRFDLIEPGANTILSKVWQSLLRPGWTLRMQMWAAVD